MGSQRVGHDWVTELNWTELMTTTTFTVFHYNRYLAMWEQSLYVGFEWITDSQRKASAKLDKAWANTAEWIHLGSGPDRFENVFEIGTLLEPSWQEVIINWLLPHLPGPGHWQPSHIIPQPGPPDHRYFPHEISLSVLTSCAHFSLLDCPNVCSPL